MVLRAISRWLSRRLPRIGRRALPFALLLAAAAWAGAEQGEGDRAAAAAAAIELLISEGRHEEAIPAARALLAQTPANRAENRAVRVRTSYLLGSALHRAGNPAEAEAVFEQGLAEAGRAPGLAAERQAMLATLAHLAGITGRFDLAEQRMAASLALIEGDDAPERRADALYAFAVTLAMAGDNAHAVEVAQQVLADEQALAVPRRFDQGLVRFLLATALLDSGRPQDAEPVFAEAAADFAASVPAGHPVHPKLANNRGNALKALERLDEAGEQYRRALDLYVDQGTPERLFPIAGQATIALWQGRAGEARATFDTLVPAIATALGERSIAAQFARAGQVAAQWAAGELDAAFAGALANEDRRQAMVAGLAAVFSDRQALALKGYLQPDWEWLVALAAQAPSAERVDLAWSRLMAARGEVTATTALRRAAARAADDAELAGPWQDWLQANQALAEAALAAIDGGDVDSLLRRRQAADRAERALARRLDGLARARAQRATTVQALAQALPADAALVVQVLLRNGRPEAFDRTLRPERFARRVAFVLTPDAPPRLVDLGQAAPIEALARSWHRSLRDPNVAEDRLRAQGARLRQAVLDPLALPASTRRLFLVADGALARVAFAALPAPGGGYLVEAGWQVHLLEHEQDLLLPARSPARPPSRLVLVGSPDGIAGDVRRNSGCQDGFPPLPHAGRELDAIAALWPAGWSVARLQGVDAGKAEVSAALPGGGILHFATHALAFAPDCRPDQRTVVLAGADPGAPLPALVLAARDDGRPDLLSADEVAALDLAGTGWAVLSACETGLGVEQAGEGVFGLRRAFRIAGAATVVMSLWPVQDAASADWMAALYRARLVDGLDTVAAVASAQRSALAARRAAGLSTHPYFWAAFVAAGDPR